MSPAQTSGLDSYGWRLRCPFSLSAARRRRAEDSYGIEDGSSSKNSSKSSKGEGPSAEETGAEGGRQGPSGQGGPDEGSAEGCRACLRQARTRGTQGTGQQCRGDQGGRHQ